MDHDFVQDFTSRKRPIRRNMTPIVTASRRRLLAMQHALAGMETDDIVQKMRDDGFEDYDLARLAHDLRTVKSTWRNATILQHQERAELEDHKLNLLEQYAWSRIQAGESENPVGEILAIAARRAKLLGLDKPKRLHVGGDKDSPLAALSSADLARMIEELGGTVPSK